MRFPPGHLVVPHDHAVGIGITRVRVFKIGTVERHRVAGSRIDDIRQSRPEPRERVRGCRRVVRPLGIGLQGVPRVELTRERDRPVVNHKLSAAVPEGDRNLHGHLVPGLQAQFVLPVYVLADVAPVGIVQRILGIVQGLYAVLRHLTGKRLDSRACPDDRVANGSDGLDRHLVTRLISGPCGEGLDGVNVVVAGDDGGGGVFVVGIIAAVAESYIEGARITGPTTGFHADHLPRGVIRGRIGPIEDRKYHVTAVIHDRNELGRRQVRIRIVRILGEVVDHRAQALRLHGSHGEASSRIGRERRNERR